MNLELTDEELCLLAHWALDAAKNAAARGTYDAASLSLAEKIAAAVVAIAPVPTTKA